MGQTQRQLVHSLSYLLCVHVVQMCGDGVSGK
jgi:hypothetical protein